MAEIGWLLIDFGTKVPGGIQGRNGFSVNCQTDSIKCWGKHMNYLLIRPCLELPYPLVSDDDLDSP